MADAATETTEIDIEQIDEVTKSNPDEVTSEVGTNPDSGITDEEPDTFPRDYVEKLRDENAKYRQRAGRVDDLAAALWAARVEATGRLADPTDLPLPTDVDPLDPESVTSAVEDLLSRKPHLASRRPRGDVGQGIGGTTTGIDLAGILRSRA